MAKEVLVVEVVSAGEAVGMVGAVELTVRAVGHLVAPVAPPGVLPTCHTQRRLCHTGPSSQCQSDASKRAAPSYR